MKTLFQHTIDGMIENNENNGANFSDWEHAGDAIDTYKTSFTGENPGETELAATIESIDMIIMSNGEKLETAIHLFERRIR